MSGGQTEYAACWFVIVLCLLFTQSSEGRECALILADDTYLSREGETYIELPPRDIGQSVEIKFQVLVDTDPKNHDGVLFAMGNPNKFQYYQWKDKAIHTQFLVIEFTYSALSLLLKALGKPSMYQLEVYKTWPTPYSIGDGRWHNITVLRQGKKMWKVCFDSICVTYPVAGNTNVDLQDRPVYIGGRPGYRHSQFKGILRNLRVNGQTIQFSNKAKKGHLQIRECDAVETRQFINILRRTNK